MADSLREKLFINILDFFDCHCKKIAPLVSEAMDHPVSIVKQWKIKFHLLLCEFCHYYKEQLETVRNLAGGFKSEAGLVWKFPPDIAILFILNFFAR